MARLPNERAMLLPNSLLSESVAQTLVPASANTNRLRMRWWSAFVGNPQSISIARPAEGNTAPKSSVSDHHRTPDHRSAASIAFSIKIALSRLKECACARSNRFPEKIASGRSMTT